MPKEAILKLIQSQQWAIIPDYLGIISEVVYSKYVAGPDKRAEQLDKFHAEFTGRPYSNVNPWMKGSVAVIPCVGVVGKRMNMVEDISSGAGMSTDMLKKNIEQAMADPAVTAIVLDVDSPGGTVSGVKEAADYIFAQRGGPKPIIGHANELAASAGYWLISACEKVVSTETGRLGSIGVYTQHYDFSEANKMAGVLPTYIYAGKYKVAGNPDQPLSTDEKAAIQSEIDDIYSMFVDSVALHRGVPADTVAKDAKVLQGPAAKERGLVDAFMTLDEAIQMAAAMADERVKNIKTGPKKEAKKKKEETKTMELEELMAEMSTMKTTMAALAAQVAEKDTLVATLQETLTESQKKMEELVAANLKLDKELTVQKMTAKAKDDKVLADGIVARVLGASALAESLHGKVTAWVSPEKFKTAEGAFDAAGFETAFAAEVNDLAEKTKGIGGTGIGLGEPKGETTEIRPEAHADENDRLVKSFNKKK